MKNVFLKCNLQYTTPIIWGGRVAKSDVSPQRTLLSVCGVEEVKLEPSGAGGEILPQVGTTFMCCQTGYDVFICLFDPSFICGKKVHA